MTHRISRGGMKAAALLALTCIGISAQTALDLKTQSKNVDFSSATTTKPNRVLTGQLPELCSPGETVLVLGGGGTTELYGCASEHTWKMLVRETVSGANSAVSFTGQTTVMFSHNFDTTNVLVSCYDGAGLAVEPHTLTITDANTVTVSFAKPQSGRCVANGTTGGQLASLAGQTGPTQSFSNDLNVTVNSAANIHALGWVGQLPISRGGTGGATAIDARGNLLPGYGSNQGKCLQVNAPGTDVEWTDCGKMISLGGQVGPAQTFAHDTNITMNSANNIHSLGWTGQLAVSRGGTGAATAEQARANLMPGYASNQGKCLQVNAAGTDAEWTDCGKLASLSGQSGPAQSFANDTNVTVNSANNVHAIGWTGQLAVSRGGTGATTTEQARANLLPAYASSQGKCLQVNAAGTDTEWTDCGRLSSLSGQTGLTQSFANDTNVTMSSANNVHSLGWTGHLPISRGGTGSGTAEQARASLLPGYTSNQGKCLQVNAGGTDAEWVECGKVAALAGQTGSTQTFASDTNVTISSANNVHSIAWAGLLGVLRGGTGASNAAGARVNLLPQYGGNQSKCLAVNSSGTDVEWAPCDPVGASQPGVGILMNGGVLSVDPAVIPTFLSGTASLTNWGTSDSVPAQACAERNIAVVGATTADAVTPRWPALLPAGLSGTMYVSSPDTVTVRLCNVTAVAVPVTDGLTFGAMVLRAF